MVFSEGEQAVNRDIASKHVIFEKRTLWLPALIGDDFFMGMQQLVAIDRNQLLGKLSARFSVF